MKSFIVKAVLTVAMFTIIITQIDVMTVLKRFAALPPLVIVLCLCIAFAQIFMLAYRWKLVSLLVGVSLPFSEFVRCTLAAQFFSQGLPASVGGDALRIWWLTHIDVPVRRAAQNVLIDRLAGFTSLVAINVPAIPLLVWMAGQSEIATGLGVTLGVCTAAVVASASRAGRWLTISLWRWVRRFAPIGGRFKGLLRFVLTLQSATGRLFQLQNGSVVMFWGILIHLVTIIQCLILSKAAGLDLSFLQLYAVVPGVLLVSYLPFSIGGWGIREGSMIVGLGLLDVPTNDAVFIGLALGSFGLVSAFAGALIWLIPSMPKPLLRHRS